MDRESVLKELALNLKADRVDDKSMTGTLDGESVLYYVADGLSIAEIDAIVSGASVKAIPFFGEGVNSELTDHCTEKLGCYGYYTAYMQGDDLFVSAGIHYSNADYYDFRTGKRYQ
ncbi:hypothetical protein V6R21_21610 [Limibacter armeniacum]|uniref:hypothetical protein n=1 Tax=Limibacter armeniacum TaxID=466084 RepID=UPI002FE695F6